EELTDEERQLVGKLADRSPLGRTKDAARQVPLEQATTPVQRLLARGLLLRRDSETVELPRQLALAVRGDHPMGPVESEEPIPELTEPGITAVDSTAAGEVLELLRHMESLLTAWGEEPPDVLRSGGIGVRDLRAPPSSWTSARTGWPCWWNWRWRRTCWPPATGWNPGGCPPSTSTPGRPHRRNTGGPVSRRPGSTCPACRG